MQCAGSFWPRRRCAACDGGRYFGLTIANSGASADVASETYRSWVLPIPLYVGHHRSPLDLCAIEHIVLEAMPEVGGHGGAAPILHKGS